VTQQHFSRGPPQSPEYGQFPHPLVPRLLPGKNVPPFELRRPMAPLFAGSGSEDYYFSFISFPNAIAVFLASYYERTFFFVTRAVLAKRRETTALCPQPSRSIYSSNETPTEDTRTPIISSMKAPILSGGVLSITNGFFGQGAYHSFSFLYIPLMDRRSISPEGAISPLPMLVLNPPPKTAFSHFKIIRSYPRSSLYRSTISNAVPIGVAFQNG